MSFLRILPICILFLLSGNLYVYATPPQRSLDREELSEQAEDSDFAYGQEPLPEPEEPPDEETSWDISILRYLLYGGVITGLLLLAFLVLRRTVLVRSNPNLQFDLGLQIEATDIRELDTQTLLSKARAEGDYRLAVRLLFLEQLKRLTERNLIDWQPYKTNYDYLAELEGKAILDRFQKLTLAYEYVWYGGFELDEGRFEELEQQFRAFLR